MTENKTINRWIEHGNIEERIVIQGVLVLDTPAHFGNGDSSALTDMPILRDPVDHSPVLTGSSIAGALRARLAQQSDILAGRLFGKLNNTRADESAIVVYDARGASVQTELRDQVRIDPATRTVDGNGKFDMEVIPAGACFQLRFDVLLMADEKDLLPALGFALAGLQSKTITLPDGKTSVVEGGSIGLGKRKSRGFGRCHVQGWQVRRLNMRRSDDLVAWIRDDVTGATPVADICDAFGKSQLSEEKTFTIWAEFALQGSLLIRSEGALGGEANSPDLVPLKSQRGGKAVPVISGTSLAGVLRGRALRIAKTFNTQMAEAFVESMFGSAKTSERERGGEEDTSHISRLRVSESVIDQPLEMVHTRVKIDRFTGGAYPSGLFSEQPVFAGADGKTRTRLTLTLSEPTEARIGLLLLLLKDLWTGDLPIGGESSVGRGRLKGVQATLSMRSEGWTIEGDDVLKITGEKEKLEQFVNAFTEEMK